MKNGSHAIFQHYSIQDLKTHFSCSIEGRIQDVLGQTSIVPPLSEAVKHSVLSGGKRFRPLFALMISADLGGDFESLLRPAVSLELLHAASLIHDDLPALDNDDFRRGQPSCHKLFGEATAILAGDLLISLANYNISQSQRAEWHAALGGSISKAFIDLCNGQQIDLIGSKSLNGIRELYRLKTGALFRCAAEFAAISADVNDEVMEFLSAFGERFGLAFQMADDFTDIFGSVAARGRPESSDLRNKKHTWCSQLSREEAVRELRHERDFLLSEIQELSKLTKGSPTDGLELLVTQAFSAITLQAVSFDRA